jgi:hypothetical protein
MTLPVPRPDFVVFVIVIVSRLDEEPRVKDVLRLRDVNIAIPISIQGDEIREKNETWASRYKLFQVILGGRNEPRTSTGGSKKRKEGKKKRRH